MTALVSPLPLPGPADGLLLIPGCRVRLSGTAKRPLVLPTDRCRCIDRADTVHAAVAKRHPTCA